MIKSVLVVVLSILALSSAQLASAPQRVRNENNVVQSSTKNQDNTFGRSSNLRNGNNKQRNLADMSLSMPGNESTPAPPAEEEPASTPAPPAEEEPATEAPTGCMSDGDCAEGVSCDCWLSCRFCVAAFAPCGTCAV